MNEGKKTLIYAGVALVVAATAYLSRPKPVGTEPDTAIGTPLFASFSDPLVAKSLEIVKFDENDSSMATFKVTQSSDGSWSIPSHQDYPADAENQLRDAATALVDLKILGVATDVPDDHAYFGVLAPDKDKTKAGEKGVGLLVKLQDEKGTGLAQLVIGKADKKNPDQRFVRIPTQDRVYVVKIDTNRFTTKFGDWIEKDLLKLNAFDVETIQLRDYSINRSERGFSMNPRLDALVRWDADASQWRLGSLSTFARGKAVPAQLAENEELNKEKLDAMKTALDDLQIVDVQRKPKGLTADLKADAGFMNDNDGIESLFQRGFFPLKSPTAQDVELYSANGEVHVGMKDGVEYVLRFGNFASVEEGSPEANLNRYLFVTARLDETKFPPPELEPEPADVPVSSPTSAPKPEAKPVEQGAAGANGGAEPAQDETKPAAEKPAAEKPAAEDKPADKPTTEKPAADKPAEKPAAEKPAAEKPVAKPDATAERERIKKDNQRKLDEWKEKRNKADTRVKELNSRFADWYYVISEETYKKIHLGRADIIKEKTGTSDEGFGVDSFRRLTTEGLKKGADTPAPKPEAGFNLP